MQTKLVLALLAASAFPAAALAQGFNFFVTEPPKTAGEYLGFCKTNSTSCASYIQGLGKSLIESGEKAKKPIICIPKDTADRNDYERIHRWVVLRPERHRLPTRDVLTDALKAIYPCTVEKPPARAPAKPEKSGKSEKK